MTTEGTTTGGQVQQSGVSTSGLKTGFLVVVSLMWGAGLAGGHLLTHFDLAPDDWQAFAWTRVVIQVLPAALLGGYILLFVKNQRFLTSRVRLVVALGLVAIGLFAAFPALHALFSGVKQLTGTVEGFDTKTWRDESGVEHAAASLTVRSADGETSLSATGESLARIQRASCALGTQADVAYLPGLEIVFSAKCAPAPK
jgi:hypothetical protein